MNDFEEFWCHYPRKVGKALAEAKYAAITASGLHTRAKDTDGNLVDIYLKATPDELLRAVKVFSFRMMEDEVPKKYIKQGDTWLNKGSWMDEEDHIEEYMAKIERHEAARQKLKLVK